MSTLLTAEQAAEALGCEVKTIYRMIARGALPARRIGDTRLIRVEPAELEKILRPIPAAGAQR